MRSVMKEPAFSCHMTVSSNYQSYSVTNREVIDSVQEKHLLLLTAEPSGAALFGRLSECISRRVLRTGKTVLLTSRLISLLIVSYAWSQIDLPIFREMGDRNVVGVNMCLVS